MFTPETVKLTEEIFKEFQKHGIIDSVTEFSESRASMFEATACFPLDFRITGIILGYLSQALKDGKIILKSEQEESK